MPILFCVLLSTLIWRFVAGKKGSLLKTIAINILLTLFVYSYYIGYSANTLKAAIFRFSPNAVYFTVMSVVSAALMCIAGLFNRKKKETISNKIDYHTGNAEGKAFWLIILVAFLIRITGVNWGAGQTFQPDEGKVVRPPIYGAGMHFSVR